MNREDIYVICNYCYDEHQMNVNGAYKIKSKAIEGLKDSINNYLTQFGCFLDRNFSIVKSDDMNDININLETDKESYAVLIINNEAVCYWLIESTQLNTDECESAECKLSKQALLKTGMAKLSDKQKDFIRYFHLVWETLGSSNFIDVLVLEGNTDLKIGLHYVMKSFHLCFVEREWGTCRFICLVDENSDDNSPLTLDEILKKDIDLEELDKLYSEFAKGITPDQKYKSDKKSKQYQEKEFGWLSPTGEFTESPFGTHEESAKEICDNKGFSFEAWEWMKNNRSSDLNLFRDFLTQIKGYCLIHNPSGFGGYIVTHMKPLTKKQKEFLYGYFMDMEDRLKAEKFIN